MKQQRDHLKQKV